MPPKEKERNEFELMALEEKIGSLEYDLYVAREQLKNAIPIPEGATNGDVIKAMFPNAEYRNDILVNVVFIVSGAQLGYVAFRESWWNAPYEGVK